MNWYKYSQSDELVKLTDQYFDLAKQIYGNLDPQKVQNLRQWLLSQNKEEIIAAINNMESKLKAELSYRKNMDDFKQQEEDELLETSSDTYQVVDYTVERVVCSSLNPQFEKKGMPAYELDFDIELKGYFGIHAGDADGWLPILARDGYCDGNAYIYNIDCGKSPQPFYEQDDHHISDKTDTPSSSIVFSKYEIIPANLITLDRVIRERDIEEAPDLY